MATDIVPAGAALPQVPDGLPLIVGRSGKPAATAWRDFFDGRLANDSTRRAYATAVRQFMEWAEDRGLDLPDIRPGDVGVYLREHQGAPSTKKQHLSALRRFFNLLVERHVCIINPAAVAEAGRYSVVEGKTPQIASDDVRKLLQSIGTDDVVGLRDRAAIATMIYTAARAGAVARLRRGDFLGRPGAMRLRFLEKGGKSREIEVRHDLETFIDEYLAAARMKTAEKNCPLFRPALRKQKQLRPWIPAARGQREQGAMRPNDMCRMVKRRLRAAELPEELSAHSFRVATITDLIGQGIPIEDVQHLAGHRDARTTKLYDRTDRKVTRNLVERISF